MPHSPSSQDKTSLLVFCLHKTSEKGTLVWLEEPSVFPGVMGDVIARGYSSIRQV